MVTRSHNILLGGHFFKDWNLSWRNEARASENLFATWPIANKGLHVRSGAKSQAGTQSVMLQGLASQGREKATQAKGTKKDKRSWAQARPGKRVSIQIRISDAVLQVKWNPVLYPTSDSLWISQNADSWAPAPIGLSGEEMKKNVQQSRFGWTPQVFLMHNKDWESLRQNVHTTFYRWLPVLLRKHWECANVQKITFYKPFYFVQWLLSKNLPEKKDDFKLRGKNKMAHFHIPFS